MTATSIQWTDRTWNPVRGCTRVSRGCQNCYAERMAARGLPGLSSPTTGQPYARQTAAGPRWTGVVELIPSKLTEPLRWKKPCRVFVNSMSDLFHESLRFEDIAKVIEVTQWEFWLSCRRGAECACECGHDPDSYAEEPEDRAVACRCWSPCAEHTYQILTKRPARMREFFRWLDQPNSKWTYASNGEAYAPVLAAHMYDGDGARNLWLGVSVEDQATADARIPVLRETPAALRFLSLEPLLEGVDISLHGIAWVIVGGESGPGARPFDAAWARSVIAQCREAGVACFVKQLGSRPFSSRPEQGWEQLYVDRDGWEPSTDYAPHFRDRKGGDPAEWPADLRVREFPA